MEYNWIEPDIANANTLGFDSVQIIGYSDLTMTITRNDA
jgi:hypothetical protein